MRFLYAVALAFIIGGCAAIEREHAEDKEQLLSAAGFTLRPADTPTKLQQVEALPQRHMMRRRTATGEIFVYADAAGCTCVYTGTGAQFQAYKTLLTEKDRAELDKMAAEDTMEEPAMDWPLWGLP